LLASVGPRGSGRSAFAHRIEFLHAGPPVYHFADRTWGPKPFLIAAPLCPGYELTPLNVSHAQRHRSAVPAAHLCPAERLNLMGTLWDAGLRLAARARCSPMAARIRSCHHTVLKLLCKNEHTFKGCPRCGPGRMGLDRRPRLCNPVQQAWIEEAVRTVRLLPSGMIVAAFDLLARNPKTRTVDISAPRFHRRPPPRTCVRGLRMRASSRPGRRASAIIAG